MSSTAGSARERARFFAKVDRNGPVPAHRPELGPCHVWTGARVWGYGHFWFRGKIARAHRVAFFLAHGRWPEPQALHHCDNRSCVNDAHLFEGTQADNLIDMVAKGRSAHGDRHSSRTKPHRTARGERHGSAKLTEQDVLSARAVYALGDLTQAELASKHGVARATIGSAVNGVAWREAGGCVERVHPRRVARGERVESAKLTAADVREIRSEYRAGGVTQKDLSRRHGVGQSLISKIVRRAVWAHVP